MVIGLFGRTCAGKSIAAQNLGQILSLPVRHCGESVKALANQRGVNPSALSDADHASVDAETRRSVENCKSMIVEGSFLDCVLGDLPGVVLVRLDCNDSERSRRFMIREQGGNEAFVKRDKFDDELRARLYGAADTARHWPRVDTSGLSQDESAAEILRLLPDGK